VTYSQPVDRERTELRTVGLQAQSSTLLKSSVPGHHRLLNWSPDGRFLAAWWYPASADPGSESYLVLIDTQGRVQRVDSVNSYFVAPRFSPWFISWIDDR